MESFGIQFRINNQRRFDELASLWAQIKHDKDTGTFRSPSDWAKLIPDAVKANFRWPTAQARSHWKTIRHSSITAVASPQHQLSQQWDFDRIFESIEESCYEVLGCERVLDSVGELQINPNDGYPYGGVGPLIALAEGFGFEVLGVNECGRFETRAELLNSQKRLDDHPLQQLAAARRTSDSAQSRPATPTPSPRPLRIALRNSGIGLAAWIVLSIPYVRRYHNGLNTYSLLLAFGMLALVFLTCFAHAFIAHYRGTKLANLILMPLLLAGVFAGFLRLRHYLGIDR